MPIRINTINANTAFACPHTDDGTTIITTAARSGHFEFSHRDGRCEIHGIDHAEVWEHFRRM